MPTHFPSKPLNSKHISQSNRLSLRFNFKSPIWPWPHPIVVHGLMALMLVSGFGIYQLTQQNLQTAWPIGALTVLALGLHIGGWLSLSLLYKEFFMLKQQQQNDEALIKTLVPAHPDTPELSPTQQLYELYNEQLKLAMVASFMLLQDTQSTQNSLHQLNKKQLQFHQNCAQQHDALQNLAKHNTQQLQNTKNNIEHVAKALRDLSDIQNHLETCTQELGKFKQFAFECKQTLAVLHRHNHSQQRQISPALQQQQQHLLNQLEHMQEHTEHMLQHINQANVGMNVLEKQQITLQMALKHHQEQELRAEETSSTLVVDHDIWQEHLQYSNQTLQQTLSILRKSEELASSLDHRLKGQPA